MPRLTGIARFIAAAWVVPTTSMILAFHGFVTAYSDVFSMPALLEFYESGIHRYRILGRLLFVATVDLLDRLPINYPQPPGILVMDPAATPVVYAALLVTYIVFTCVACSILLIVLRQQAHGTGAEAEFIVVGIALFQALTTYAMTPYDPPAFALLAAGMAATLRWSPTGARIPLALIVALATLVRESAWITIVFFVAVHHRGVMTRDRSTLATLAVLIAAFLVPYIGLRFALGWQQGFYDEIQFFQNGHWTSLTGLAMLIALAYLLMSGARNPDGCRWFLVLSLPYIIVVSVVALPWEIRLWTPVLVPLVVLRSHVSRAGEQ